MTGTKEIEGGVTKMVVLGGHFEMGDFYDYRNDRIVTGRKCWDSKEIAGATWKDNRFTLKLKSPESGSTKNKWENMGLKEHSQVSIMAGLIENHRGAAKYLNDRDGLSEASQVLICRVKSRKLKLDFKTLISQNVPQLQDLGQETQSEKNPTHVVVGVTYGAEAYCVLVMESDENARKGAEEFLSKIARKMEEALDNYLDLSNFKEQFDKEDKTQLTRVKCRMYADLHTSAFRECRVFEAYKQCYKIIQQVQNTEGGNNESIPIAILLCPLKAILGQIEGKQFEYHDVDSEVVARCGLIWNELDRICAKSAAIRSVNKNADKVSFRQFEEAIAKYKELVQKSLKNGITKARETGQQDEIERVINIGENHPIFNPSRLEQWLQYQQAECEMYEKISSITDIVCLSSKKQLEMELQNSFDAKYTLVLSVPLLDERMNGILEAMKNYVDSKLVYMKEDPNADTNRSVEADCEGSDDLGHGIQRKQKHVLAKIREFTDHVEKNKHLENIVQFFIVFRQSVVEFGCRYSVYETGRLLTDNFNQLPRPPTGLRIHPPKTRPARKTTSTYAIDLEWDYEDLGFPCHFLVEYRLDGNKDEVWTQRKTTKSGETQLAIPYTSGSAMTIRVAADTCIGRSEFSEVVDTVTVRELNEDQEAIHEKEFLVSKAETSVGPKNEEEMDRSRKTEPAATSMSTSQQPIETKNAEAILLCTSHVVTSETPRKGWKAPDSTNMSMNEEPMLGMDQENEFGDHMTDDSDEDDAKPNCKKAYLEEDDGDDEKTKAEEKTKNNAIEQHVKEMVVLEGGFQLGDLYDYRSDRILTEGRKYVESSKIGYPIKVNNKLSLEFKCSDSSTMNNKMENMGLDEHLQATFMAGLIEKPRGGSRYLTYCCSSSQAAQVLICRVESKVAQLDLQNLAIQDVTHLYDTWKKTKSSKSKTNPTHIVVGVTYGAEAYCVLTQDLKDAETDDDSREEAEQFLSKIAKKVENALEEELNLAEFKQQFDMNEKKQLSNIKCYLYTDLQTGVLQECSVPDVYKHFLKFTQQVKKTGIGNNKSIPIAVSLCPLQAIMEHDEGGQFEFYDVDPELISRCARIWDELDQVCAKSVAIRTVNKKVDKSSLRQFEEAVGKYKSLMQTSLKKGIAKARETGQQSEIEKAAKITENHSIFKPSQLVQWLLYKQGECEMYEKISKMAKNLPLASKKTVEKKLGENLEMKYTVVLSLPCLEQRTNKILRALKDYTDKYNTLVTYNDEENETDDNVEEESNRPWNHQTQKYVLSKVREFAEHVEKNKHLENQVQFLMTFCETDKDVGCRYSVYDATRLLKDNISQLPQPPTGLRVHAPKMSNPQKRNIVVAWDYAELGFPCYFLVEYRRCDGNDETWTQKKTTNPRETQITIPYKTRSAIEFRVAADTCIGRSEFSEVINTESECDAVDDEETSSDTVSTYSEEGTADIRQRSEMRKTGTAASLQTSQSLTKNIRAAIKPPTDVEVETVTQSTAELGWVTSATENRSISYRVRYWQYGQDESQANELEVAVGESGCRLEGLLPETTYKINIVAVSDGGREMSEPSETLHLVTVHQHVRFAETMAKRGIKIGDRNGMNLLAVPLTKSPRSNSTVVRFAFGKESGSRTVLHKTILVMGATGAGKTTLINGMINYIFNVEWEDTFRFQLIREQLVGSSQSQSQTSGITAYDIHHAEGFRVPYSLTIVDTPGYGDTKGLDRDKEITEMIRKFFEDKSGIQNLDIIGFVAQASLPRLTPTQIYIFDSVLSIFGNDVEENIDFLLTFADCQNPPILSAITAAGLPYPKEPGTGLPRHHKFNNSGFFCSNRESGSDASNTAEKFNRFFWRMGMENFKHFFSTLAAMKTKSLSLTKQVLEERRRLEATVEGLQPLIKIGLTKMEEMRKTKQVITNSQAQIDANENVEIEVEVHEAVQVKYDGGCLTNCNKCHVTCHIPCYLGNTENKLNCTAMDHSMPAETRSCTVCPQKCIWNLHENQPYKWEYVKRKKTTSSDAIKEKYEAEMNRKLTAQQLVEVLERDVQKNDAEVLQQVETVTQCIKRLEEIALRPNPFSTPQYIDLIIDSEQQEKRQGYKERIESLKKLRKMAVITSKIKNNENLMSLDRKDDYEA
uniref:Fibronectin type-III domain-containing protein n=1 Tax=Daphnia magna TaxID=35525 RepID=A0A0P4ZR65_9CRUS